jgi:tRNA modification GTPase
MNILDEVIIRRKEYDRVYGAETVEIGCHAGGAAAQAVMDAFLELGADRSSSEDVLESACEQGRISRIELDARNALENCFCGKALSALLAELHEHPLERETEEICRLIETNTPKEIAKAAQRIRNLLNCTWAIPYVEPQPVFIAGFPNVGKSSLFNALTGVERVIVHDVAGTTRDVVDEMAVLGELPVRLHDSAGVGESATGIEKKAQGFAFRGLKEAALVLFVFDGSRPVKEGELKLYGQLDCAKLIPIINKTDLPETRDIPGLDNALKVSALTGRGIPELGSAIAASLAPQKAPAGRLAVFTGKQEKLLENALKVLENEDFSKGLEILRHLLGKNVEVPDRQEDER